MECSQRNLFLKDEAASWIGFYSSCITHRKWFHNALFVQIENLLELVQIEQNIYNVVFHELIRQVSVECAERGQLLAKLRSPSLFYLFFSLLCVFIREWLHFLFHLSRQRYVSLLDRIPRQVKGLHTETLAQKALDRRLTEDIIHFKSSIAKLNM